MAHNPFSGLSRIFCDTGFFYAALSSSDSNHQKASDYSHLIQKNKIQCVTTWDVISETLTLLVIRHSYQLAIQFMDSVEPTLEKIEYGDELREKAKKTFKKFNKDQTVSFCDCLSYQVICDYMGRIPALSFDGDFRRMGLTVIE